MIAGHAGGINLHPARVMESGRNCAFWTAERVLAPIG